MTWESPSTEAMLFKVIKFSCIPPFYDCHLAAKLSCVSYKCLVLLVVN